MSKNKLLATSLLATVSLTTLAFPSFAATDTFQKGGDFGFDGNGDHDSDEDDIDIDDDTVRIVFAQTDLDEAPDHTGKDEAKGPSCNINIPDDRIQLAFEQTRHTPAHGKIPATKKDKRHYKISLIEDLPIEFTNMNFVDTVYLKFSPTIINYKGDSPETASEKRYVKGMWSLNERGKNDIDVIVESEDDENKKYDLKEWANGSKGRTIKIRTANDDVFREDQIFTLQADDVFFKFDLSQDYFDKAGRISADWADSKYELQIAAYCSFEDHMQTWNHKHDLWKK